MEETLNSLIFSLREWYCQQYQISEDEFNKGNNDIGLIKFMKLLFFISAARGSDSSLLQSDCNNFYALPYGPVESDVYDGIKTNLFEKFIISNQKLKIIGEIVCPKHDDISKDVKALRDVNPEIITYEPFRLVDISHKWFSWQYAYSLAKKQGRNCHKMNIETIKIEEKYFY